MSEMSMLMHGMGLEAFVDERPDVNYELVDVDESELIEAGKQTDFMVGEIVEQQQRVTGLINARDYAAANRETLSEEMATELRSRVIAVLGEDRGARLVGSVENYNGANGLQLLDCGLESIGGMITAALAALVKLIRTGARIMMNFFASAKVVLGNQLRAIGALSSAVDRKIEGWDEFMVNVNNNNPTKPTGYTPGGGAGYFDQKVEPLKAATKPGGPTASSLDFTELALAVGDELIVPGDLATALRMTANHVEGVCLDVTAGLNKQYGALLGLFGDADKINDGVQLYAGLQQLSADKFLPIKRLIYQEKESSPHLAVLTTGELLGGDRFTVTIDRAALYASAATQSGNRIRNVNGFRFLTVTMRQIGLLKFPRDHQVRALNRSAAQQTLSIMDKLLKTVIDSPFQAEANELSRNADKIATTTLARMNTSDSVMKTFQEDAMGIISNMTVVTAAGPRLLISYVNNLSTAVRSFVALSGGFN